VNPYNYTANLDRANMRPTGETDDRRRDSVSFPSVCPTAHAKMNTIRAERINASVLIISDSKNIICGGTYVQRI
jgi:hypothetical protein